MAVNLRLKRPASQTRVLSRVAVWDVVWGGTSPLVGFFLRDGTIKSPEVVAIYCGIALLTSLLVFQWFQTSAPISRYFSIRDAVELLKACILIAALAAAVAFLFTRLDAAPRSIPLLHLILLAAGLLSARLLLRLRATRLETKVRPVTGSVQHVLLIEASPLAWFFSKMLEELAPAEYQIVAILDERPQLQQRSLNGYPIVGAPANVGKIVDEYATHGIRIDKVIAAVRPEHVASWDDISRLCRERQIALEALPERLLPGLSLEGAAASTDAGNAEPSATVPRDMGAILARPFWKLKRAVDFAVALTIAILAFPITLAVFAVALLDVGTPVIFWQRRVGRNGVALHLYKFRTLQALFDRHTKERREAHEPSTVGRFLQKTRLDELPQLWNVISGDMSLIGPRPLLPVDQPSEPSIRLTVRPGLSGWAQVCGGKLISPAEKNALDEWYIRHASFWLDIVIVLRTLRILAIGDRRDEKAISIAIGEKLQNDFVKLAGYVAAATGAPRTAVNRAAAVRSPGTSGQSPVSRPLPARSDEPAPAPRSAFSR